MEIPYLLIGVKSSGSPYAERIAVRGIIQNERTKQIAMVHVAKQNYYRLPGGRVEPGENRKLILEREILEETGCKITTDDMKYIGEVEEYHRGDSDRDLHRRSFCYFVKLLENTGQINLTEEEILNGYKLVWVSAEAAFELVRDTEPNSYEGRSIRARDLFFIRTFFTAWGEE